MHNFKIYLNSCISILKFIIKCFIILIAFPFFINFLFRGDIKSFSRVMMEEMYKDGEIDLLFVGSSHTMRGINVKYLEDNLNINIFNSSTSQQNLQTSYYLIKEIYETNGIKKLFLDLTYNMLQDNQPGHTETYLISDYMATKKISICFCLIHLELKVC